MTRGRATPEIADPRAELSGEGDGAGTVRWMPWTAAQLATLEAMALSLELQAQAVRQHIAALRVTAEMIEGPTPAAAPPAAGGQGAGEFYHEQYRR